MSEELPSLTPPERLLCGPGPSNVEPSVLDAMRKPMLGHLDPDLHDILLEAVDMLRRTWRMPDGLVLPLHCTGTAGMEAGLANLLEPGDTAIVARSGFFGRRICEIATRCGAEVIAVNADWGIDYAYSCTQKCLAAPPGMSPVAVSEAALERIRTRRTPPSFSFDLLLLEKYWVERPAAYHHTAPVLAIYALHEALRLLLEEGLEARWARHAAAGAHLRRELAARGVEILAGAGHQLAPLTALRGSD